MYKEVSETARSEFRAYTLCALAVMLRSEDGIPMAEAANGGGELHTAKTREKRPEKTNARLFHVEHKR